MDTEKLHVLEEHGIMATVLSDTTVEVYAVHREPDVAEDEVRLARKLNQPMLRLCARDSVPGRKGPSWVITLDFH